MRISFTKVQALRNDFVLVDGRTAPVADPPSLARFLCDRKEGVGADTLLLLHHSDVADLLVRIFNPDGSEGEMSGNGTRCVAAYSLAREGEGQNVATVETVAGVSRHELERREHGRFFIRSSILAPRFHPTEIPVRVAGEDALDVPLDLAEGRIRVSGVSIGNPQAVVFQGWTDENWKILGPQIENHPLFPERTNVDFARVAAEDRLEVKLWERGVGPVESSGTGASGAFAAARRKGLIGPRAELVMEGGTLVIEEAEEGLILRGWCEECFEGTIDTDRSREGEVR
ncbi:MAG: diaminopimelate epimerase [Candidatus Eisenbacteria bacterium]|nr:diaminopimelate epimerase [Candidatus Eisenbacteria bacterium]